MYKEIIRDNIAQQREVKPKEEEEEKVEEWEANLKAEIVKQSEIESKYNNLYKDILGDKSISQFGYGFFKKTPKSTSPVSDDYVLGFGDGFKVYLWGDPVDMMIVDREMNLSVSRDGTVYVPNVGIVSVSGMKIADLKNHLSRMLGSKFKNLRVDIVLTKLRTFNVYITGFVNKPSMVSVDSLDTLMNTLIKVGGVSKVGSLRKIEIRRKEEGKVKVIDVDLYDLFIKGIPVDMRLRDGDVVYVHPIGDVVAIFGEVKRPAIYEIKNERELQDIVNFAGGFNPSVSDVVVRVSRYSKDGVELFEGSLEDRKFTSMKMQNGDFVFFGQKPEVFENAINVSGEVYYPGLYSLKDTKTLKELVLKVKLKENAGFLRIVRVDKINYSYKVEDILSNSVDMSLQPKDKVFVYSKYDFEPVYLSGEVEEERTIPYYSGMKLIDVFNTVKFRVPIKELKVLITRDNGLNLTVVYLNDLIVKNDTSQNIELKPGDVIIVKKMETVEKSPSVTIIGEVIYPGKYTLQEGMKLSDVIEKAGGYTSYAYPTALIFVRESAKKLQLERLELTFSMLQEQFLKQSQAISIGGSSEEKEATVMAIEKQKQALETLRKKAEIGLGRIAIDIPRSLEELKNSNQNIEVQDGDVIIVPKRPNYVLVLGDVYNQINLPYIKGYKVKDYISMVGGYRKSVDRSEVHIIKANGKVVSPESYGRRFFIGSGFDDYELSEGDTIVVPSEIRVQTMWRPLIKDIVQIIFQSISTAILAKRL
ncbi:MAG: SLBB domain-containing protein [Hydrogenothermaceae bacterium]|nr:SLBB domain-containing protein [Hydrogenothermaceae bacterium]